ncbi:hypothetical protein JCM5296_006827 [Sporobolomyces johnsonii]
MWATKSWLSSPPSPSLHPYPSHSFTMSFLGMRAWPVPFLRPMWPFLAGGLITFYGVAAAQDALLQVPEYRDSPKNPHRASAPAAHH